MYYLVHGFSDRDKVSPILLISMFAIINCGWKAVAGSATGPFVSGCARPADYSIRAPFTTAARGRCSCVSPAVWATELSARLMDKQIAKKCVGAMCIGLSVMLSLLEALDIVTGIENPLDFFYWQLRSKLRRSALCLNTDLFPMVLRL